MKSRALGCAALVLCLLAGLFGAVGVAQASARTATWVVSVTYQNVASGPSAGPATINVNFYQEGSGIPVPFNPLGDGNTLPVGAGASFFIGWVSGLPSSFRGSAVMESDQPLIATVVQFSQQPGFKVKMLSNGYRAEDAATQYLIATALANKFARTTIFSVQNTEQSQPIRATIKFYDADNSGNLASTKEFVIPAGSSKYIEMDNTAMTGLPTVFNGSAVISAVIDGTSTPANIVAGASELATNADIGANFEGVPLSRAANTVYMATALCQQFGLDTSYAVQNASTTPGDSATITVEYRNPDGSLKTTDGPYTIGPGQKQSIRTCMPSSGASMAGFTGAATITSAGAPIVAIGKAGVSQLAPRPDTVNMFTAFMGEPQGASKLALPYVRWANDANYDSPSNTGGKQRSTLAIQNLEDTTSVVNVKYYDKAGNQVGTQQLAIPAKSKGNSTPAAADALGKNGMIAGEFGYYADGSYGGAAIIEADATNPSAKFIAIARVAHPGFAEDYNGVAVP